MSFSDDINKFSSKASLKIERMMQDQKVKIADFLKEKLGEEYRDISSIKFDNDVLKFYDVVATDSVIIKLRDAGYLRD